MYILEISEEKLRSNILLLILNSILKSTYKNCDEGGINPDFTYLEKSVYTKTDKIGIKDIHDFKQKLCILPEGNIKLAIINNAQYLTLEAENALLKELEEELENTIIILAVNDKRKLLPTILSRGISLNINEISLIHDEIKQEKVDQIVYNREEESHQTNEIKRFLGMDTYDKLLYITKNIEPQKGEKDPKVSKKMDLVESFLSNLLLYYEDELLNGRNVVAQLKLIENGIRKIQGGVTPKVVLEYITLSLHNG